MQGILRFLANTGEKNPQSHQLKTIIVILPIMENIIGRMIVLVNNYDNAFQFYSKNFGFKLLFDYTTEEGQRFLHIGNSSTQGIWFLKANNSNQALVGNQTGDQPLMVIYTSDINSLYLHLQSNNVKIKFELVKTPDYSFFHCFDLYGNEIVVVELEK